MNTPELKAEIRALEGEIPDLEATVEARQSELDKALGADHAHPDRISQAKVGIRKAEEELRDTRARLDALRDRLPSAEEEAEASAEAERIRAEYEAAGEEVAEEWDRFRETLALAIQAHGKVDAARQRIDAAVKRADKLYDRSGHRPTPKAPQPLDPDQQRLARRFGSWLDSFTATKRRQLEDPGKSVKSMLKRIREIVA